MKKKLCNTIGTVENGININQHTTLEMDRINARQSSFSEGGLFALEMVEPDELQSSSIIQSQDSKRRVSRGSSNESNTSRDSFFVTTV